MSNRRRYCPEYKHEAVQLVQQSDISVSEIARNLGINSKLLRRWVKLSTEPGKRAFPGHGNPRDEELARLHKELRQVKKERDFLREAAGHQGRSLVLWQKKYKGPVVLHSDRGSQFTGHEYQQFLRGHDITCSMSAVGSCYDNAAAKSFFGLLKRKRVNRRRYATRAESRADVFDYIELFYNPRKQRKLEQLHQTALN